MQPPGPTNPVIPPGGMSEGDSKRSPSGNLSLSDLEAFLRLGRGFAYDDAACAADNELIGTVVPPETVRLVRYASVLLSQDNGLGAAESFASLYILGQDATTAFVIESQGICIPNGEVGSVGANAKYFCMYPGESLYHLCSDVPVLAGMTYCDIDIRLLRP